MMKIFNLHLGSGASPWVSIPCLLQDTSHIYWFHPPNIACTPLFLFVCFFPFLFHLLFLLSLTLVINILYCLNYTSLLLYFITTHFVSHLSLSFIISIVSYTNYQHLLLSELPFTITWSHYNTPCKCSL